MDRNECIELSVEDLQEEIKNLKNTIFLSIREMNRYEDKIDMEIQYRGHSPRMEEFEKKCGELEVSIKEDNKKLEDLMNLMKLKMDREVLKEKMMKLEIKAYDLNIASDEREIVLEELTTLADDIESLNTKINEEEKRDLFILIKKRKK